MTHHPCVALLAAACQSPGRLPCLLEELPSWQPVALRQPLGGVESVDSQVAEPSLMLCKEWGVGDAVCVYKPGACSWWHRRICTRVRRSRRRAVGHTRPQGFPTIQGMGGQWFHIYSATLLGGRPWNCLRAHGIHRGCLSNPSAACAAMMCQRSSMCACANLHPCTTCTTTG